LTPEAVIDRYLEAVSTYPHDPALLGLLLGTDADLLSRWLLSLSCPAEPGALLEAITALPADSFRTLALAQCVAVLAAPGSARLAFEQWRAALTASLVGEALAVEKSIADPEAFRWRVLLASSGVILPHDPWLVELQAFRGSRRDLLEDASIEHRLFAVVEAFDGADAPASQDAARQLLNLDTERYRAIVASAEARRAEILASLRLAPEGDADATDRVWLRLQLGILEPLLASPGDRPSRGLREMHPLVSRRLLGRVPVVFLVDAPADRLVRLDGAGPDIARSSQTSVIARCVRLGERSELIARADQAVADRQVLRSLGSDEGLCLPGVNAAGNAAGALVFALDEEADQEAAMAIYAAALGRQLTARGSEGVQENVLTRYRRQEEKRLRELVHEANNPLSIVNNYLHILELRLAHEPQAVEQLKLIGAELRRTGAIIAQARSLPPLDLDREEAQVEYADVDLNELARQLVELHLGLAADFRVSLGDSLVAGSLIIRSDRQRLAQILNNLMRNAIEAAPGASVTVSTVSGVFREGREGVLLGVADTGPGLPRNVAERLAEPKQSTKGGDHSGLGLHIVHRLVGELGGSIDVRTGPGQGTAFTVFLPVSPR
jgi:signal transduction histidine kinase